MIGVLEIWIPAQVFLCFVHAQPQHPAWLDPIASLRPNLFALSVMDVVRLMLISSVEYELCHSMLSWSLETIRL